MGAMDPAAPGADALSVVRAPGPPAGVGERTAPGGRPADPVTHGPEVMLAARTAHVPAAEKAVLHEIAVAVIEAVLPSPYRAALEVARGKPDFQRDFRRAVETVARRHPQILGRVDADHFSELAWARAEMLVEAYVLGVTGVGIRCSQTWARRVIRDYEEVHSDPVRIEPDRVRVRIESSGPATLTGDGFASSGLVREGTLHEIAEDYPTEAERQAGHRRIEEMGDAWRRREAEGE